MHFRLFYVLKCVQTVIIAFALWRVFAQTKICGTFVNVKEVIHHGIEGSCRRLFIYVYPSEQSGNNTLRHEAQLRLWWFFEGSDFLPEVPSQKELLHMVAEAKQEMFSRVDVALPQKVAEGEIRGSEKRKKRDDDDDDDEEADESELPGGWAQKKESLLPDQEPLLHEFRKKSGRTTGNRIMHGTRQQSSADENTTLFCYELNLQESAIESMDIEAKSSPLVLLGNRSVVTVAVALAHLLLLFAQIYLLNCLDEDNFEQKRGKLFLELFVVLLGCLGWLIVFLLQLRTEFDWQPIWACTNFRPNLLGMIIIIQLIAAILVFIGLFEGIRILKCMRKYTKLIEKIKERDHKTQRPKV